MSFFDRKTVEYETAALAARGQHAKRLLADDVFIEAIDEAERTLMETWKESKSVEVREHIWAGIHSLDEVSNALRKFQSDGEFAEEVLEIALRKELAKDKDKIFRQEV